jgi:hypothetical protein
MKKHHLSLKNLWVLTLPQTTFMSWLQTLVKAFCVIFPKIGVYRAIIHLLSFAPESPYHRHLPTDKAPYANQLQRVEHKFAMSANINSESSIMSDFD